MKKKVVVAVTVIVDVCREVLVRAPQVLNGYDPANSRVDKETLLLWEFCRVLVPRLGLDRFVGTQDRGAPSLAVDAWQKIVDLLSGRIMENPHPNEVVAVIRTHLLDPALRGPGAQEARICR